MTRRYGKTAALRLLEAERVNRSQIRSWLWIARYRLRRGEVARALEAMSSVCFLLGRD